MESRPDGVYIQISVTQVVPGARTGNGSAPTPPQLGATGQPTASQSPGSSGAQGRSWSDDDGLHYETPGGDLITLKFLPNIKDGIADGWIGQIGQRSGQFPYILLLNGRFQGIIWLPTGSPDAIHFEPAPNTDPLPPAPPSELGAVVDPYTIALGLLAQVPLPNIQVRANPDLGLVALPDWFWVDGYNGRPFGRSETVMLPPPPGGSCPCPIITVTVRVWGSQYQWDFGDGTVLVSQSRGQRYPQVSDIQHTYEYSSLAAPQGFPVRLTVEFDAEYQVDGGPFQPLPPIRRTYDGAYRVQEVQSVLTSR